MSVKDQPVGNIRVEGGKVHFSVDLPVALKLVTAWTENKVDDAAAPVVSGFLSQLKFNKDFKASSKEEAEAKPAEQNE